MKYAYLLLAIALLPALSTLAQDSTRKESKEEAYTRTINSRADKIVATLNLTDANKAAKVKTIIANQYRNLNNVYTKRDEQIKTVKETLSADKVAMTAKVKEIEETVAKDEIAVLHNTFLKQLSSLLTPEQVEAVKDGMTYNLVKVTYNAYLDEIPRLTTEQKDQIKKWLIEAREYAMDAESSEKKHAWFGKYKGKINNYLSAAGYDMKKEGEEWQKRIAERNKKQ